MRKFLTKYDEMVYNSSTPVKSKSNNSITIESKNLYLTAHQNTPHYVDYREGQFGKQNNFQFINPDANIITQCSFKSEIGASTLEVIKTPQKSQYVSPDGTNGISATLDKTLVTNELLQCAAVAIVDKTHNLQTLLHCNPEQSAEENRAILEYVLSHSKSSDLEITIAPGFDTKTENMIDFIVDNVKDIMPDAKIKFVNFPDSDNNCVVLQNGVLKCCTQVSLSTNPEGISIINAKKVQPAADVPAAQNNAERSTAQTMNFEQVFNKLRAGHVNYTLFTTADGKHLIKIENTKKLFSSQRFDYYAFDKDGKLLNLQTQVSEKVGKERFAEFKDSQQRNIHNRGGNLNAVIPVMDIADAATAGKTAEALRKEIADIESSPKETETKLNEYVQRTSQSTFIDETTAKNRLQEFLEENSGSASIIERCKIDGNINEELINEAIYMLKHNVRAYDCHHILYGLLTPDRNVIDYGKIKKLHNLVDKGGNIDELCSLLGECEDKNGLYSEDLYNKLTSLKTQDYSASSVLDACKIDGEVVESIWGKALELETIGFDNSSIANIIKACCIKEKPNDKYSKTTGFSDELYAKAKLLYEEYKFDAKNISYIIEECSKAGEFSQEYVNRAINLHNSLEESLIYRFIKYPDELTNFAVELKNKYSIKEYDLESIVRECTNDVDGKKSADTLCMEKVEELISQYGVKPNDVAQLLYATKLDGKLDLKLYKEVISFYKLNCVYISDIIKSCTIKSEGKPSVVNYDLIQKAKEWASLGIDSSWIREYAWMYNALNFDVKKNDFVSDYTKAGFVGNQVESLLETSFTNLEDLSPIEFRDKVLELQKLDLNNDAVIHILSSIGLKKGGYKPTAKLSKQNLDIVTDMLKRGVKDPTRIVYSAVENWVLNQKKLNTDYERIKAGIPEKIIQYIHGYANTPEEENLILELSKVVSQEYDYNDFNKFSQIVKKEIGTDIPEIILESLKNGVKEKDIENILNIYKNNYQTPESATEIKIKLLNALKEHPDKAEQIQDVQYRVARDINNNDLAELDLCLKYLDRFQDIITSQYSLDYKGERSYDKSERAKALMIQLDKYNIPLDDILKYTDILCAEYYSAKSMSPEIVEKIVELHNNKKLDENILWMTNWLFDVDKKCEVLDYIIKLRDDGQLSLQNKTDVRTVVKMLEREAGYSTAGIIYDNYKEILDFYKENKEALTKSDDTQLLQIDIIDKYKSRNNNQTELDIEDCQAILKMMNDADVSRNYMYKLVQNLNAGDLSTFVNKIDIKEYSEELKLLVSQMTNGYYFNDIGLFYPNISKRDLTYIMDMQKLLCENPIGNNNPQILNDHFIKNFISKEEIPEQVLDRFRFLIETELSYAKENNEYFYFSNYNNTISLYTHSPKNIERIENIKYNNGFEDGVFDHIAARLSSNPDVLTKQLDLIESILDYTGYLSVKKAGLQNDIIGIFSPIQKLEDIDAEIEVWEQQKATLPNNSTQALYGTLRIVAGVNSINKDIVLSGIQNNKYKSEIVPSQITSNNIELVDYIIKNDKLQNPKNLQSLLDKTYRDKEMAEYIKLNFDKIPQDEFRDIIYTMQPINSDLILRLYNDKELNFPKDYILRIAYYCNETNIDLVTRLCTDKNLDFPGEYISKIASKCNSKNIDLITNLCTDKTLKCPPDKIADIADLFILINKDIMTLSLSEKINIFATFSDIDKTVLDLCRKCMPIDIDTKISELANSLGKKKDIINIPFEQQKLFETNILANNNKKSENVLKTFDFGQYEKKGLPLKYTREEFTSNIENLLKDLSEEEQQLLLGHFGLIRGSAGFDGLPTNKPFDAEGVSEQAKFVAQKMQNEIELFTSKNQVNTGDGVVDEVLTALIQGLPEFTSIVGKEQHGTHKYSVDIHTLKVLQSAMNNPLYEELSDGDKTILKMSALCHDFGKKGGIIDDGHASTSAEYVVAIMDKFSLPQRIKDRIIDIVENHHWFEAYNIATSKEKVNPEEIKKAAQDVVVRCRRPGDFEIYEILAKADFENVNESFHLGRSGVKTQAEFDKFMQDKMKAIEDVLTEMYSNSNLVFDTQFVANGEKFPRQVIILDEATTELKVLNLNDIKNSESLTKYGFSIGVTKGNARFTVHMTAPTLANMESVWILTQNSLNQSSWSTSLIKASNNRTYCNKEFGFIFDTDQANISTAYYANIGSGNEKGLETFRDLLFENSEERTYVKEHLTKNLSKKGINLDDSEYSQLAKYLATKKYTTQITQDVKINNKIIKAKTLIECLETSRDALFEGGNIHSEIVSINPRVKGLIAKVEKLEDCPIEFLRFAKAHNLPIILMKPNKEN